MDDAQLVRKLARERLDRAAPIVDDLVSAGAVNLDWYLREKIVKPDHETYLDHRRVLKYARLFGLRGRVTFLIETRAPTPDLQVDVDDLTFYAEVKKVRFVLKPSGNPVLKIVTNIEGKLRQLTDGSLNLVAIDNFDLSLESEDEEGLTHEHIQDAFRVVQDRALADPPLYGRLGAAIFAANTSGGVISGPPDSTFGIPHFVWLNPAAAVPLPNVLRAWLPSTLPGGQWLNVRWLGGEWVEDGF
jgi:hypothetical protein